MGEVQTGAVGWPILHAATMQGTGLPFGGGSAVRHGGCDPVDPDRRLAKAKPNRQGRTNNVQIFSDARAIAHIGEMHGLYLSGCPDLEACGGAGRGGPRSGRMAPAAAVVIPHRVDTFPCTSHTMTQGSGVL